MTNAVGENVTLTGPGTLSLDGYAGMGILVDNSSRYSLTIHAPLATTADQTWRNNSLNLLTIGAADISNNTVTVDGYGTTHITGPITGGGGMAKNGAGTLILSRANTFGGTTRPPGVR